ncbi:hypothetical protein IV02_28845 [Pseudomonas syringae]|uniref:DUF2845 domain-containing protein n=1 Tax=Pseudomonas syringae TaxID=317 RepID=A0A085UMP1_PSESX|nr:hypothetical protein IV02_28845 [Pseudomonas syringae]
MTTSFTLRVLLGVGLLSLTCAAQASSLRCGSQLISVGDRAFEVQQKCGVPVSQDVIGSKETFNSTYRRSEEVRVEEWIYGPDHGMYQYLRFEGGRLVRIDSQRQR